MPRNILFRVVLPFVIAAPLGFVALAYAAQSEPTLPAPVIAIFSPGLELAEMLIPRATSGMGTEMSWFLRIAIFVNTLFYFVILAFLAYLLHRLLTRPSGNS